MHPLPERLVVVGGGYVGLEFASMFAHYGSAVTVLDRGPRPLRHEDPDVAATAAAALEEDGVRLLAGASVTRINDGTDAATVSYTANGAEHTVQADAVLIALGRTPATEGLDLDDHRIVADQLTGTGARTTTDRAAVPYTIFLTPPLARVGLTEDRPEAGHE